MDSSASAAWTAHARAALDRAGHRRGAARDAVLEHLGSRSCAASALEIEDALRAEGRRVGRASIYRVLDLLHERGLVDRLELGHGLARYEVRHAGGEHHHHLVCDRCGRVQPFSDPPLERAIARAQERVRGFEPRSHEIVLHGACAGCHG